MSLKRDVVLQDSMMTFISRRHFLKGAAALGGLILIARDAGPAFAQITYDKNPFSLGVASGDPLPDGIVLWTRLAPHPLEGGGMPPVDVPVRWKLAADEGMKIIVQQGTATAGAALGHSVHVEVAGLQPARNYWYQFETAGIVSPIGRTRTAPAPGASPEKLRFAFASCQNWTNGFYTAYKHMAKQDLDFVVHLGDYIYEGKIGSHAREFEVPAPVKDEPMMLEQYRLRYSLYKLDSELQATHQAFPFIVTWDDHEVENNYAASIDENNVGPEIFLKRRAQAYQAYYEHMPLRATAMPNGPDMMLYRRFTFGDLAQFSILDTRQYRSDQLKENKAPKRVEKTLDPARSLMGATQRDWLFNGLDHSNARWNVIAQQIIMTQFIRTTGANETFNMDAWDGYPAERQMLMAHLNEHKTRNAIVLAGDSHSNLVSDLKADFDRPESAIVGSEFAGTAITSGGSTPETQKIREGDVARQAHLKWFEGVKRGYVSCTLDRKAWRSEYLQVENVKQADSPVNTSTSWVVEDSKPGVQRA